MTGIRPERSLGDCYSGGRWTSHCCRSTIANEKSAAINRMAAYRKTLLTLSTPSSPNFLIEICRECGAPGRVRIGPRAHSHATIYPPVQNTERTLLVEH